MYNKQRLSKRGKKKQKHNNTKSKYMPRNGPKSENFSFKGTYNIS